MKKNMKYINFIWNELNQSKRYKERYEINKYLKYSIIFIKEKILPYLLPRNKQTTHEINDQIVEKMSWPIYGHMIGNPQ